MRIDDDTPRLGRIGVWSSGRNVAEAAGELDRLGYGAIWLGSSPGVAQALPTLAATTRITVATGILSIWDHEPAGVAAAYAAANAAHGGRFLLGLGVSHGAFTERYRRPYSAMREYLTGLDEADQPVPGGGRVLAALGPKMLELARDRAAGAHPYLVTPEHTARARAVLGDGPVLAPELKVVLDPDPAGARATARSHLARYLALPNYTGNLVRLGFADEDFADGGSDRLLDALFALGDADAVRRRADEHLAAGADHLAVQVVTDAPANALPMAEWRTLAAALPLR